MEEEWEQSINKFEEQKTHERTKADHDIIDEEAASKRIVARNFMKEFDNAKHDKEIHRNDGEGNKHQEKVGRRTANLGGSHGQWKKEEEEAEHEENSQKNSNTILVKERA